MSRGEIPPIYQPEDIRLLIPNTEAFLLCKNTKYNKIECGLYHNYKLIGGQNIFPINLEKDATKIIPTKTFYPNWIQKYFIYKIYWPNIKY